MNVIKFLWDMMLIILLLTCNMIVIVGSLWVLRVAIDWWLNIDYVEWIKKWLEK